MKRDLPIIVDRGQFDNIERFCDYCFICRNKKIICKGGKHELEHFSIWYQWYCKFGISRIVFKVRCFEFGLLYKICVWLKGDEEGDKLYNKLVF